MLQVDQFTKGHNFFPLQICMCNTGVGEFTMRCWARNRIISRMPEDTRFEVKPRNILHFTDSLYLGSSSASSQSSPGFSCDNLQSNYSVVKHRRRLATIRTLKLVANLTKLQMIKMCQANIVIKKIFRVEVLLAYSKRKYMYKCFLESNPE